ncbi:MAG: S8 family serine peptidase [Cyclobacteriaceae bacterium]|nr:S8 family serine peptidase [Cyclobacteriaceae bacterium]
MSFSILFFCLFLKFSQTSGQSQENYVKGKVLVCFKEGALSHAALNHNNRELDFEKLFQKHSFKDSLKAIKINRAKKLIRNSKPGKQYSYSRTGEKISIPSFYNWVTLEVPDTTDIPKLCSRLIKMKHIQYAEPDYILNTTVQQPNDPLFSRAYYDPQNRADINALRAWDFTKGSNSIRVAIVDSGIDYTNPDLGETFGSSAKKVTSGFDYQNNDFDPMDDRDDSHGTGVAGIVGALSNNGDYVTGVAGGDQSTNNNGVQLIALKVGPGGSNNIVSNQYSIEAIYDAATSVSSGGFGCHVINYSAGTSSTSDLNAFRGVLSYAAQNGVIFVAAKGNENTNAPFYPADLADNLVLSVGAMNGNNVRANFSNYGGNVDIIAPGDGALIYTTGRRTVSVYQSPSGTSVAAPFVTGVAALLKSYNLNLHRDDIENLIQLSANDITDDPRSNTTNLIGYDQYTGHGKLNAGKALEFLAAPYVLEQKTAVGGTVSNSPNRESLQLNNDSGIGLSTGVYIGKRYEVKTTVTLPASLCNERYIWARTSGATLGWSAAVPNNQMGNMEILSVSGNTATLRTWVFYIESSVTGQQINTYYPTRPENVVFAYTLLTNQPLYSNITGPTLICTTGNFTLQNVPVGNTLNWSSSNPSGLAINPSSGLATRVNNFNGQVTITATIIGACGSLNIPTTIWVGVPSPPGAFSLLSGNLNNMCKRSQAQVLINPVAGASSYVWLSNNPSGLQVDGSGLGALITGLTTSVNSSLGYWSFNYGGANTCGSNTALYGVVIYNCTAGDIGALRLTSYPNPASDSFTVTLKEEDNKETAEVTLFDKKMERVYFVRSEEKELSISSAGLPAGLYYLNIVIGKEITKLQILINH